MGIKVCGLFNIAPLYRGGIFRLMDRRLDIDFYFGDRSTGSIALLPEGELTHFAGYLGNRYRGSKLVWQRGFAAVLRRQYDAYILTGNPGIRSNWIVAVAARLMGRRVVLWGHGMHGNETRSQLVKSKLYFRLANHIMVYGDYARGLMIASGVPSSKISVVYNSLDYANQSRILERIGDRGFIRNYFGNDDPVISFVGRLTPDKSLDMLVNVLKTIPLCNLILVGDGPAREALERQVHDLRLTDRVWFYGETYDEILIGTILHHSVLCVSPGSIGLTAIHSLMFGTPVVTHDNFAAQGPEFEAITEGLSGGFFRRGNPESLTKVVGQWVEMMSDLEKRNTTRAECRKIIDQKYNPEAQIKVIEQAINR